MVHSSVLLRFVGVSIGIAVVSAPSKQFTVGLLADGIRAQAKGFSSKLLARRSRMGECTIRNVKNGKGDIRPWSLRKLIMAIHDLQNKT